MDQELINYNFIDQINNIEVIEDTNNTGIGLMVIYYSIIIIKHIWAY